VVGDDAPFGDARGRVELGLEYGLDGSLSINARGVLDGIGDDGSESRGLTLGAEWRF